MGFIKGFQAAKNKLLTLIVGTSTNYTQIEEDGTIVNFGNATTWDDKATASTSGKRGALSKPDFDYTNIGLLFPQNDTAEIVYVGDQMLHKKKMNSVIKYHVHYIQTSATQPIFKIDYKYYNNGAAVPGSWTTLSTADGSKGVLPYTSGSMLQIATFLAITPPANETVSAMLDVKFYRDDNDLSGDSLVKYIDFHFEIDTQGSRSEYSK